MVNGRQKGSRGEREVARHLAEWWGRLEKGCEFMRTPLSGGWSTEGARTHFKAHGDIMTTAKHFPFCVEVKYREQWSPKRFFLGHASPCWEWWLQCLDAAEPGDDVPMMWLRKSRVPGKRESFPWLVILPSDFTVEHRLGKPDVVWSETELLERGVDYGVHPAGFLYERFLKVPPKRFKR